ncbi:TM2 domain-containing protein [Sphingomonas canadensis]|uniref:TM2 domain-containing protein n=1 Tax=Sphingomonas canadensis TaxID=1219257 RepID=A0ABW3H9B3_9SPHN|nr:TM2 domain-containing protein [Sphingomonas canadensis]MCW3836491.1 TM2 domain-containing protein [Sphingomonas canadensis]
MLAIVLALLVGGLGIHKFYLGRIGWGIVYLLLCWTFIPAFVAFIEALTYVFMSDEAFHAKYG